MRTGFATALILGTLAFSPMLAAAGDDAAPLEQLAIDSAHTSADHAALAKYYRSKAAAARAEAASHESMARSYTGTKMAAKEQMQAHCQKISQQEKATADEYDALAKLHDDEAKKPQ
jgi:uncharacterized membrane protein